jgi:hypothetical protein
MDTDTGEFQEKRLAHREEAETFYRALAGCGKTTVRPEMLLRFHDLCG